jgi:hypothetical protein
MSLSFDTSRSLGLGLLLQFWANFSRPLDIIALPPCPKLCKSQNRFQFEVIIAAMDDGFDLSMTKPTHLVRRERRMTRAVVTGRLHSVAECLRLFHCVADSGHGAHAAEPKTI